LARSLARSRYLYTFTNGFAFCSLPRNLVAAYLVCVFHTKLDKDFAASWTGFSHEAGHGFHGKLDSDFAPSWTVIS